MPNIHAILNQHIRRLARREINAMTRSTRHLTAQYRRDIAALKRRVAGMSKTVTFLDRQEKKRLGRPPEPETVEGVRFRADGLRSHRKKLGVSAADYGKLVGVSDLTMYNWETGKTRPRQAQFAKYLAVRGIGKREAQRRLESL